MIYLSRRSPWKYSSKMATPDFLYSMTMTEIRYLRGNHYFIISYEHPGYTLCLLSLFIPASDVCLCAAPGALSSVPALVL